MLCKATRSMRMIRSPSWPQYPRAQNLTAPCMAAVVDRSLGELEESPAAVTRSVSLHGPRSSIAVDTVGRPDWNSQGANKKDTSRPTWFLGNEDDSHQVNRINSIRIEEKGAQEFICPFLHRRKPILSSSRAESPGPRKSGVSTRV